MAAVLAAALLAVPSAPAAPPVFVLTGKGYGHGIGLSQYGAQGFARHGWTYTEILARYYRGSAVTAGQPNDAVEVLLASGRASLAVGSDAPLELADEVIPAGTYTVTPLSGQVRVAGNGLTRIVASPASFEPGSAALELGGAPYRGDLLVASSAGGTTLAALNTLSRESYIRGVVPREMPASWEPEALKAQAVAARTYSLAGSGHCVWPAAPALFAAPVFCSDTRDQVYGGLGAETAATNAAVQATARRAVTYGGAIATTYFFSTSGGRTAAKADEWGGPAVPYLVSVKDPYDSISPHHAWGPKDAEADCAGTAPDCVFTAAEARAALGLTRSPTDLRVTARNSSGRVATLTATDSGGTTAFTGTQARTELALRSTWFSVGVLSLAPSKPAITYGGSVRLSGLARSGGTSGWGTARLERRRHGESAWARLGDPLPNGAWSRTVKPIVATDYRVVSGNATGSAERVSVRTRVRLVRPRAPFRRLTGTVGPARARIAVTLERRRADGTWALRGTALTRAGGGFAFTLTRTGTYRARADAGAGYLRGEATVTVPPP